MSMLNGWREGKPEVHKYTVCFTIARNWTAFGLGSLPVDPRSRLPAPWAPSRTSPLASAYTASCQHRQRYLETSVHTFSACCCCMLPLGLALPRPGGGLTLAFSLLVTGGFPGQLWSISRRCVMQNFWLQALQMTGVSSNLRQVRSEQRFFRLLSRIIFSASVGGQPSSMCLLS